MPGRRKRKRKGKGKRMRKIRRRRPRKRKRQRERARKRERERARDRARARWRKSGRYLIHLSLSLRRGGGGGSERVRERESERARRKEGRKERPTNLQTKPSSLQSETGGCVFFPHTCDRTYKFEMTFYSFKAATDMRLNISVCQQDLSCKGIPTSILTHHSISMLCLASGHVMLQRQTS